MKKIYEYLNEKTVELILDLDWFKVVNVKYDGADMIGLWKDSKNAIVIPFTSTILHPGVIKLSNVSKLYFSLCDF